MGVVFATVSMGLIFLSPLSALFHENVQKGIDQENLIQEVSNAKKASQLASIYERVFKNSDRGTIQQLKRQRNVSIALRAAWQNVLVESVPARGSVDVKLDSRHISRFVGFIEGRCRLTVPTWWEQSFLGVRAHDRTNFVFPIQIGEDGTLEKDDKAGRINTVIEKDGLGLRVRRGLYSEILPSELSERHSTTTEAAAILSDKMCFVAFFGRHTHGYTLYAIDRKTKKVIWKKGVWAGGVINAYSGPGGHIVEIVLEGDRLIVFGCGLDCAYLEGFKAENGECEFRFSTRY
jgi:hypothetical protein